MGCTKCGDKPEKKHFTNTVVEINNPEQLVLLRKVVIPASLGDEEAVPPAIGKYRNVILQYEINGHIYIYSSDGIPTSIEASDIPQDILDRLDDLEAGLVTEETERELEDASLSLSISSETTARQAADNNLQGQIDAITVSSDVKDVVGTKAQLNNYDTSTLGDNDIIKVLQDESENDATTYYRWNATTQQFALIGEEGPYYTKAATDTLLNAKADKATTYTKTEVDTALATKQDNLIAGTNISIASDGKTISATDTTYTAGTGLNLNGTRFSVDTTTIAEKSDVPSIKQQTSAMTFLDMPTLNIAGDGTTVAPMALRTHGDSTSGSYGYININEPTSTIPEAYVGGYVWDVAEDWWRKMPEARLALYSDVPTIVQTTGTSTTNAMSQNAVTNMIYADPATTQKVAIGAQSVHSPNSYSTSIGYDALAGEYAVAIGGSSSAATRARGTGNFSIAIGNNANAGQYWSMAMGPSSRANAGASVALGYDASASGSYSLAIGSKSTSSTKGEVSFGGSSLAGEGYSNSQYRLLTNVYDPQNAHDAATKGYVDTSVAAIGAGTRRATSSGWNTSAPLDYILQWSGSPAFAQGAMFSAGDNLSDFPVYVGIGICSADTSSEPLPYLLTQTTSDDGQGTTDGRPSAYRMALYSEVPTTFTTNEWNALWA